MCYYSLYMYSSVQGGKKGPYLWALEVCCAFGFLVGVFSGGGKEMLCQFVWILGFKVQPN